MLLSLEGDGITCIALIFSLLSVSGSGPVLVGFCVMLLFCLKLLSPAVMISLFAWRGG